MQVAYHSAQKGATELLFSVERKQYFSHCFQSIIVTTVEFILVLNTNQYQNAGNVDGTFFLSVKPPALLWV